MFKRLFYKILSWLGQLPSRLHLRPGTVAAKCRLQFGVAIIIILFFALLIPYLWMSKLTDKAVLKTGRSIVDLVLDGHMNRYIRFEKATEHIAGGTYSEQPLPDKYTPPVNWLKFTEGREFNPQGLTERQTGFLEKLIEDTDRDITMWRQQTDSGIEDNYIEIIKADEECLRCHNQEGTAVAFNSKEPIGAMVISLPDEDLSRTIIMNNVCVIFAGLLAGASAIITVYVIVQRVILRPIRQLRALVNNVTEGNLDARSSIKSNDEYERLADAFNSMLDGLQDSQEKLREANKELDSKIIELSDRNIELFKANKLKSEFLANMSHEFRTPLNAILGFSDILRDAPPKDADKTKRYAGNISESGRNLLLLINDLLDLAKAEAGKIDIRIEKTSISQLCRGVAGFFWPMTEKKGVELALDIDDKLPLVNTDASKVQQILYNFVSNAIKFTPAGGKITIRVYLLNEKTVRVAVVDTGAGIAPQYHERIFEKFRQIDGSITRNGAGTGLGLAISKELSNLIAARISLESDIGRGSAFYLDLPVIEQQELANTPPAQ
jgi:two-component system, NarL family, sensor histidine kinase BarA